MAKIGKDYCGILQPTDRSTKLKLANYSVVYVEKSFAEYIFFFKGNPPRNRLRKGHDIFMFPTNAS